MAMVLRRSARLAAKREKAKAAASTKRATKVTKRATKKKTVKQCGAKPLEGAKSRSKKTTRRRPATGVSTQKKQPRSRPLPKSPLHGFLEDSHVGRIVFIPSLKKSTDTAKELATSLKAPAWFCLQHHLCMYFFMMANTASALEAKKSFTYRNSDEILKPINISKENEFVQAMTCGLFDKYYPALETLLSDCEAQGFHIPNTHKKTAETGKLFINEDDPDALSTHPKISKALAQRIAQERECGGAFVHWTELGDRVSGVPANLRSLVEPHVQLTSKRAFIQLNKRRHGIRFHWSKDDFQQRLGGEPDFVDGRVCFSNTKHMVDQGLMGVRKRRTHICTARRRPNTYDPKNPNPSLEMLMGITTSRSNNDMPERGNAITDNRKVEVVAQPGRSRKGRKRKLELADDEIKEDAGLNRRQRLDAPSASMKAKASGTPGI